MRRAAVVVSSLLVSIPAIAAEALPSRQELRSVDRTGSELAKKVGEIAAQTAKRRRESLPTAAAAGAAAPIPGWTITQVGNVVYLQDDGTHNCDGQLSQEWFETCMAGTNSALEAFYAAYPDANPHFASFYLGWDINAFFAFYSPVANDVEGIGEYKFGNAQGLNGLIFMNSVDLYSSYGEAYRPFMFDMIWGQEFGHRWAAFVKFLDDEGRESKALLGRDDSHWSYFLDTEWSWMEGNDWKDNGDGSFTTNFDTFGQPGYGYSPLDLYLMGLIPPSGVPDFFYIDDPDTNTDPSDPPAIMYGDEDTVRGDKEWVSIDQVIAAEGERSPTFKQARRTFKVANLVILRSTDSITDALRSDMADYDEWSSTHFSRDTFELAYVDTTIGAPLPNTAPTAMLDLPLEAKEDGDAVRLDASASTDAEGQKLSFVWDFGDGTADYTSGPVVDHVFEADGELTVTVTVVDALGGASSTSGTINVAKATPKGDDGGPLGIGCSVSGTAADRVPAVSTALLLAAGALGLAMRRRRAA